MGKKLQAIRGMNDILPAQISYWQYLEETLRELVAQYGYYEIRMPLVEQTQLFSRTIGEVTDIVEKEMYTFEDRNGDSLTLRPEATAGCVRAGIEHGLLYNQQQRLWYIGPMYRHERPQKGRYRQFYQFGLEAFGMEGPDIDAEQIIMMARLWKLLGIDDQIRLEINTLGSAECRHAYREKLVDYFSQFESQLDDDSKRRLKVNPLRILDSKNPDVKMLCKNAPSISECINDVSKKHFDTLLSLLEAAGIKYEINEHLVRGLDYYGMTIYEWITDALGAQGTVCAGGRYNRLVEQLGGKPSPAIGFAMGLERVVTLLESVYTPNDAVHVYMILMGEDAVREGIILAEKLRSDYPEVKIEMNCGGGSYKSQFKRADKSGAKLALILGDDEISAGKISTKCLRMDKPQQTLTYEELREVFLEAIAE